LTDGDTKESPEFTDIQTGEDFGEAINWGIGQADNVLYLLSPESINSTYCQQKLDLAVGSIPCWKKYYPTKDATRV